MMGLMIMEWTNVCIESIYDEYRPNINLYLWSPKWLLRIPKYYVHRGDYVYRGGYVYRGDRYGHRPKKEQRESAYVSRKTRVEDSTRTVVTPPSAPLKTEADPSLTSVELVDIWKKHLVILRVSYGSYLTFPWAVIDCPLQALCRSICVQFPIWV